MAKNTREKRDVDVGALGATAAAGGKILVTDAGKDHRVEYPLAHNLVSVGARTLLRQQSLE